MKESTTPTKLEIRLLTIGPLTPDQFTAIKIHLQKWGFHVDKNCRRQQAAFLPYFRHESFRGFHQTSVRGRNVMKPEQFLALDLPVPKTEVRKWVSTLLDLTDNELEAVLLELLKKRPAAFERLNNS